jgi:hypothetical protein
MASFYYLNNLLKLPANSTLTDLERVDTVKKGTDPEYAKGC